MLKNFYPWEHVRSVFDIDYRKLYSLGYRGVIFDIDNTLVLHGADATPEAEELFREIQKTGLATLLLSNNNKERVERFLTNIRSLYICDADKPKPDAYRRALEMLELKREETVCVGDQIFTDVYGANRCGIPSILVDFLHAESETKFGKKRALERVVLRFYGRRKKYRHRIGDILLGEGAEIRAYAVEAK